MSRSSGGIKLLESEWLCELAMSSWQNMKSRSWQISLFIIFSNILVFFWSKHTRGYLWSSNYESPSINDAAHLPPMHAHAFGCMHACWMGSSKGFGLMWMRGTGRGGVFGFVTCPQCRFTLTTSMRRALAASHIHDDLWENRAGVAIKIVACLLYLWYKFKTSILFICVFRLQRQMLGIKESL